jgi:hypothetical protein
MSRFCAVQDRQNFKLMAGQIELHAEFKGTGAPKIVSKSAEIIAAEEAQAAIEAKASAEVRCCYCTEKKSTWASLRVAGR